MVLIAIAFALLGAAAGLGPADESGASGAACGDPGAHRIKGAPLTGDVDGDGSPNRVTLRVRGDGPRLCRRILVIETATGPVAAPVKPLPWPGTNARLLLLAEIDGRSGLEAVVALTSSAAVYRPGAVFTMRAGAPARMRLQGTRPAGLFPFDDEFPAGVDCAGRPGRIVVTTGQVAANDSFFAVRRSVRQAVGTRFEPVRTTRHRVRVGPAAERRWPELRNDPFRTCPGRVG